MQVEVDPSNLYTGKIDSEGRKFIDRDLAGEEVTVAVVEKHDRQE